jgi:drug/metabolite transporter (DMT)-like permease
MGSYPAEPEIIAATQPARTSVFPVWTHIHALLRHWWIPFGASSLFVVSGHLLIKMGLSHLAAIASPLPLWLRIFLCLTQSEVAAGLFVYFLGSLCWMMAVAQQEISFLYPLSSINYVLVVLASSTFFGETISLRRMAGVAFIVLGMVLMNRDPRRTSA